MGLSSLSSCLLEHMLHTRPICTPQCPTLDPLSTQAFLRLTEPRTSLMVGLEMQRWLSYGK